MNGEVDQTRTADALEQALIKAEEAYHDCLKELLKPQRRRFTDLERKTFRFCMTLIAQRAGERQLS